MSPVSDDSRVVLQSQVLNCKSTSDQRENYRFFRKIRVFDIWVGVGTGWGDIDPVRFARDSSRMGRYWTHHPYFSFTRPKRSVGLHAKKAKTLCIQPRSTPILNQNNLFPKIKHVNGILFFNSKIQIQIQKMIFRNYSNGFGYLQYPPLKFDFV